MRRICGLAADQEEVGTFTLSTSAAYAEDGASAAADRW
jgi:hypothetical protein